MDNESDDNTFLYMLIAIWAFIMYRMGQRGLFTELIYVNGLLLCAYHYDREVN